MKQPKRSKLDALSFGLFWTWNVIFIAFMVLGFAPRLLPDLIFSIRNGLTPWIYLVYGVVLSLVPVLASLLGATLLRRAPRKLFALGYVVEGPMMLLLAVRFFLIRQATLAMVMLLIVAALGMIAFLWNLLQREDQDDPAPWLSLLRLAGLTLMLMVSLYASLWIAFYAVPIIGAFFIWLAEQITNPMGAWRGLVEFFRWSVGEGLIWIPFMILGFLLAIYTATLFVLTPIAVPVLSIRAWWGSIRSLAGRIGWVFPAAMVLLVMVLISAGFVLANRQPQVEAFALLETPPQSIQEAQALLKQEKVIREGLLNAYLAPFRYFSAQGEVAHVSGLYRDILKLSTEQAAAVQRWYEWVATPLIYQPINPPNPVSPVESLAFEREPRQAARLYQRMFDTPIIEAERPLIVAAVRQTWSSDRAREALQAVDEREVLLQKQTVTVTDNGSWAEVEIMEVYLNQTMENQEVIYYFNLPESAVLTGLWLGTSPDKSQADVYQVAPRGAAQQIYREETVQRRDPALLEQIGPRQYRLRAYPVVPIVVRWNPDGVSRTVYDAPPLYLWFTYHTLPQDGVWPLPQLAFHRNIYWDRSTEREMNGREITGQISAWMPPPLAVNEPQQVVRRADFANGLSVIAQPARQVDLPGLPPKVRLAVVLDRSRSMEMQAGRASEALSRLKELAEGGATIDVYLTASNFRGEPPSIAPIEAVAPLTILYFGGQNPADLLAQFNELSGERSYDGILVLTDGSAYELGPRQVELKVPQAPLWMVHLSADIPLGYDDPTLEAIQASGGGVVGSLDEALQRLAAGLSRTNRDVLDGYVWTVLPTAQAGSIVSQVSEQDGFTPLLARRLVLAEIHNQRGAITDVATLDALHALAQQYSLVTPYSSMIVLVNNQQKNRLEKLAQDDDRFQREYESMTNTTPPAGSPLTGVPEPHEWVLIIAGSGLLAWLWRSKRGLAGRRI